MKSNKILLVIPVTTALAESSFSPVQRIEVFLRQKSISLMHCKVHK